MKKYLSLFVVLLLAFTTSVNTLVAEYGSTVSGEIKVEGTLTPEQREAREKERAEFQLKMEAERQGQRTESERDREEKRGELKESLGDMRLRARTMIANALLRRAENLAQISNRIKTRIEKLKTAGVDTEVAASLMVEADASIALSKTNAQKVKDAITNNDTLETIIINIKATKESLKKAHGYMRDAVKELKYKAELKTMVELEEDQD